MLTFRFTGADGIMTEEETLTSGMVGKKVKLEFSEDWKGLTKTAVFRAGSVTRDVVGVSDVAVIPAEVLARPLQQLFVGVYGVSHDGSVTPTIRAAGPRILPGVDPSGDAGAAPELPVWAQMELRMANLEQRAGDLSTLTLGVHTDGLVYIFLGGKPVGSGLNISGGSTAAPVSGDVVTDRSILSITTGRTVQLGVRLNAEPDRNQTVTVLTDSDVLRFDRTTLTFTAGNWNEYQYVAVSAGNISADTTADITLRNSDELLTETAVTVYLTADAYSVDTSIPDGVHTVTLDDFESYTASGSDKVILSGYNAAYDNIHIPATLTVDGAEKTPILRDTTFANNTTIKYVDIDGTVYFSQYGQPYKQLIMTFKNCTSLIGVKYRGTDITSIASAFYGCSSLRFVDGLERQTAVASAKQAFVACASLEYIQDLSGWSVCTNAEQMFNGCAALKTVYGMPPVIPNAKMLYYKCAALESAALPAAVTAADYCCDGCTALKEMHIYAEGITSANAMFANCTGTKVYAPKGSATYDTLNSLYGSSASIELLYLGGDSIPVVSCWGDSTTSAGTDGEAWPARLQAMLGNSVQVKNMAISGEYSTSTACRQGGNEASLVSDVTIPAPVEAVAVTLRSKDGQTFGASPVLSTGANYNPVTIAGIEGAVSVAGGQAYFTRRNAGEETVVPAGTAVISKNAVARKGDAVQIIYLGTNAGWNLDPDVLMGQVQSMVDYYGGTNYIIMGPAGGQMVRTEGARAEVFEYESLAETAFGDHWLNLREYLIANSLAENGLTATAKDTERMAVGLIPWSILLGSNTEDGTDDVHYNTHGLQSVCNAVFAKGRTLGYW